jgi:hypothetical protein
MPSKDTICFTNIVRIHYLLISETEWPFKKINIETQIVPKDLTKDVFYYRDHQQEPLNGIRNTYERNDLKDKFATLDRCFTSRIIFILLSWKFSLQWSLSVWFILFLLYLIWNFRNRKLSSDKERNKSIFSFP